MPKKKETAYVLRFGLLNQSGISGGEWCKANAVVTVRSQTHLHRMIGERKKSTCLQGGLKMGAHTHTAHGRVKS